MDDLKLTPEDITHFSETDLDQNSLNFEANALSKAKSMWVFGQWNELTELKLNDFVNHPDRDKIALLVAAAHQQLGSIDEVKKYVSLSKNWGCDERTVAKILLSGVFNSLGKVKAIANEQDKAIEYFDESLSMLLGKEDVKPVRRSRAITEIASLGLFDQGAELLLEEEQQLSYEQRPVHVEAKATMLAAEVELINVNIGLLHQKNMLYGSGNSDNSNLSETRRLKELSTSQLGQDLWVLEMCRYKRNGYFVEFGATDGILLSNSLLLEREFGWKGVCAEPNPQFYQKLKKNRICVVSDACIAGKTGETVKFVMAGEYGGIIDYANTGRHKDKVTAYVEEKKTIVLETVSLDEFLEANHAPREIDYLSIDTEGSEYEILSHFPFHKWNIRLITVEHNYEDARQDIYDLLSKHGYLRLERDFDDWYYMNENVVDTKI